MKRNEIDDLVEGKFDNDLDMSKIVKFYPGSSKGPLPEDDPDHYSEWFVRNQPTDLIYQGEDEGNLADLGVRHKYLWNKQIVDEDALAIEYKDDVAN